MRKPRLIDCRPRWIEAADGTARHIHFDCPEGHANCGHTIPVSPDREGNAQPEPRWLRRGDDFATMTLEPSIRRIPRYKSKAEAVADGCIEQYVDDCFLCAMHVNITNGAFVFHGDSR